MQFGAFVPARPTHPYIFEHFIRRTDKLSVTLRAIQVVFRLNF